MIEIELDAQEALTQARKTTYDYILSAVHDIDEIFGPCYAEAHPELVAAYIRTCAQDFHTSCMTSGLQDLRDALDMTTSALWVSRKKV